MKNLFKISFFVIALLQVGAASAQVKSNQSRLTIGTTATKTPNFKNTPVSSLVLKTNMPSEIRLNSNAAVTEFYRSLLLTNAKAKPNSSKPSYNSVIANTNSDDYLFNGEQLSISNIYPNPAAEIVRLDYHYKGKKVKAVVSFYNILGREVESYDLNQFDRQLEVNLRNWDNGVYFYQLMLDGRKVATKKLLVRHN